MSDSISSVVHPNGRPHNPEKEGFTHISGRVYQDANKTYWVREPPKNVRNYQGRGPAIVTNYSSFPDFTLEDYRNHFKAITKGRAIADIRVGSLVSVSDPKHPRSDHRRAFVGTVEAVCRPGNLYLIKDRGADCFWVFVDELRLIR